MRFLVDECTGPAVAQWLREQGHDVVSVYEQARASEDDTVIQMASQEERILITNDKDFGEKVFRSRRSHAGVVLLRLSDERPVSKIQVISRLLESHADKLPGAFIVVSEQRIKIGKRRQ
jgi:predicted nuclease of predicted toxin-antitoxin system